MADVTQKQVILSVGVDASQASAEFDNLKSKLQGVSNTPIDQPFKSLKNQIKEATIEAQKMEQQFGKNSNEFRTAAQAVATLRDRFEETNKSIASFNPDNKLSALVNITRGAVAGIQGVAGAMTALGVESDKASEVTARLVGLMNFSQALSSVDDIKNGFRDFGNVIASTSAFQKANAAATTVTSVAMQGLGLSTNVASTGFKLLKGAIVATGIGALVIGVVALIQNFDAIKEKILNLVPGLSTVFSFIGNIVQGFTDMVGITSQLDRNIDSINAKYKQSDKQIASNLKILQETGQTKAALEEQLNQYKGFVNKYIEIQKERQKFNEELTAEEKDGLDEAVNNIAITQFKIEQFDKQQAEKLKQERDKRNKEIQDKEKAKNDEIKKINQEALDAIAKANLTAWGKELFDLNKQEQSKLAVLRQGSTEYLNVQEQFRIARKEVNDKYDKLLADAEVQAFIDEVQKSYDQEKAKQEAIQKAKDDAKAQAAANAKGRTTIAEAVLIRTERENVVSDSDSPDTVRQKIDNIEKARLDAENASFNERRLAAAGNFAELIKLYQEHEQNKTQIQADGTQARIALDEAEKQAKLQTLQAVGQGLGAIGDLIGRQTVAGKALGIAQATIDTFIGANKALAQGGTIGIVTAAAVIASGLANVKRIIDTKVPNDTTGKNIPIANTNASAPIINSSAIGQLPAIQDVRVINYNNQPIRSYITQRDLDNNEAKQKFLNSLRTY